VKIVLRYLDGRDKVALLNQVLDAAGLEAELKTVRKSLRKERGDLKIAIKPNASMFVRRDDDGVAHVVSSKKMLVDYRGYLQVDMAPACDDVFAQHKTGCSGAPKLAVRTQ
jgi:hypothetical protein